MCAGSETHGVGTKVFVKDASGAWVRGVVTGVAGSQLLVQDDSGQQLECAPAAAPLQNVQQDAVEDMTSLTFLHEPGVLWNLQQRYSRSVVYTRTGGILIAINPFAPLPHLYGPAVMQRYAGLEPLETAPHPYAIANAAYTKMRREGKGQAILITGESGAGKTETSKQIMGFLAHLGMQHHHSSNSSSNGNSSSNSTAPGSSLLSVEQRVLESNPLLEAFGNAKTVRNDNSSRFGKYVELAFNQEGAISGAAIRTYLLERSRVVGPGPQERNYHIFYQACAGATAEERARWQLGAPQDYAFLSSQVYQLKGANDAEDYRTTRHAMTAVGLTPQEQEGVFAVVAALLHLGNVTFVDVEGTEDACQLTPGCEAALAAAAELLGVDSQELLRVVVTRTRNTPDGPIQSPLKAAMALDNRDSLAKVLYARLFEWLVARINACIGQDPAPASNIGLLDIYGFESFASNDLEQLCINYANEKLQQHFNSHVFKWEQAEYEREGIDWTTIEFVDNQDLLDLVEGKGGLIEQLDEACKLPNTAAKDYADMLGSKWGASKRYARNKKDQCSFKLEHYAGPVTYKVDNFLDKNKDFVVEEHRRLLGAATCGLVAQLFAPPPEQEERSSSSGGPGKSSRQAFKFVSVTSVFKRQLADLMGQLSAMEPHYVRCIKPNPASMPLVLDAPYVLQQLTCGGVMEAVRISAAGYMYRKTFLEFLGAFWQLRPSVRAITAPEEAKAAVAAMLAAHGLQPGKDYQLGHTKAFLKATKAGMLLKLLLQVQGLAAARIQAHWKGRVQRLAYQRLRHAALVMQAGARGMAARRLAQQLRQQKAATMMQAFWRGRVARQQYQQVQQAAQLVQNAWRVRAAVAQLAALQQQRAALVLQAAWRGRQGRVLFQPLLQEHRRQCTAAVCIQAAWRRHKGQRFRSDAAAAAAALVIQRIWREREQHNSRVQRWQAAARQLLEVERERQRRDRFKQQHAMFEAAVEQVAAERRRSSSSSGGGGGSSTHSSPRMSAAGVAKEGAWIARAGVAMPMLPASGIGVAFKGMPGAAQSSGAGGGGAKTHLYIGNRVLISATACGKRSSSSDGSSSEQQQGGPEPEVVKAEQVTQLDAEQRLQARLGDLPAQRRVQELLSRFNGGGCN